MSVISLTRAASRATSRAGAVIESETKGRSRASAGSSTGSPSVRAGLSTAVVRQFATSARPLPGSTATAAMHRRFSTGSIDTPIHDIALERTHTLKDGTKVTIIAAPRLPRAAVQAFFEGQTEETLRLLRGEVCMEMYGSFTQERGVGLATTDMNAADVQIAVFTSADGKPRITALSALKFSDSGEIAHPTGTVVDPEWQGKGIAGLMKDAQVEIARARGCKKMVSSDLRPPMLAVYEAAAKRSGLRVETSGAAATWGDYDAFRAVIHLQAAAEDATATSTPSAATKETKSSS